MRLLHELSTVVARVTAVLPEAKQNSEVAFWRREIGRYMAWYNGDCSILYKTPCPQDSRKLQAHTLAHSSILTWHKLHQEIKYLEDLALSADAFDGLRLLDVGGGPMPSATCFRGAELYHLEPLLSRYLDAGFPIHHYAGVRFVAAPAEDIPCETAFFDAVISVNAIDHVDDPAKTAAEIRRVLKPGGLFRMHVHYHDYSTCEPVLFNDDVFRELFGWCPGLHKVHELQSNHSQQLPPDQRFVLWSNF